MQSLLLLLRLKNVIVRMRPSLIFQLILSGWLRRTRWFWWFQHWRIGGQISQSRRDHAWRWPQASVESWGVTVKEKCEARRCLNKRRWHWWRLSTSLGIEKHWEADCGPQTCVSYSSSNTKEVEKVLTTSAGAYLTHQGYVRDEGDYVIGVHQPALRYPLTPFDHYLARRGHFLT